MRQNPKSITWVCLKVENLNYTTWKLRWAYPKIILCIWKNIFAIHPLLLGSILISFLGDVFSDVLCFGRLETLTFSDTPTWSKEAMVIRSQLIRRQVLPRNIVNSRKIRNWPNKKHLGKRHKSFTNSIFQVRSWLLVVCLSYIHHQISTTWVGTVLRRRQGCYIYDFIIQVNWPWYFISLWKGGPRGRSLQQSHGANTLKLRI